MWVIIWMTIGWFASLLVYTLAEHEMKEIPPQTVYGVLGALGTGWTLTLFGTGKTLIGLSLINLILIMLGAFVTAAVRTGYIKKLLKTLPELPKMPQIPDKSNTLAFK